MDEFKQVLATWALDNLPKAADAAKIVDVKLDFDEGVRWSEWTYENPHLDIAITYLDASGKKQTWTSLDDKEVAISMSKLLSDLFRIAEVSYPKE